MLKPSRAVRLTGALLATVLAAPLALVTPAGAEDYPRGTRVQPAHLDRGADTRVLHAEGTVIVDGDRRVPVRAAHLTMLGRSGADYVVLTSDRDYRRWRVRRVTAEGDTHRVVGGPGYVPEIRIADGGRHVVVSRYTGDRTLVLRVVDTGTGALVRRREFPMTVSALDFGRRRMVLSEWGNRPREQRTFWWNPFTNRTVRLARHPGYVADISTDRLGLMLGDPYLDGCQKVVTISRPRARLWRSCRDAAVAFSPGGRRMVTQHILTDGAGPRLLQVRAARGRVLETYRSEWFGVLAWETDRRLLLQVAGRRTVAMARCTVRRCERVSELHRTGGEDPWMVMPSWTFARETLEDR